MELKDDLPYVECKFCRTLDDCKHVDKPTDGLSMGLPPDICPKPINVMRRTVKKHKLDKREAKN